MIKWLTRITKRWWYNNTWIQWNNMNCITFKTARINLIQANPHLLGLLASHTRLSPWGGDKMADIFQRAFFQFTSFRFTSLFFGYASILDGFTEFCRAFIYKEDAISLCPRKKGVGWGWGWGEGIGFTPSVRPAFRVRSITLTVLVGFFHIDH